MCVRAASPTPVTPITRPTVAPPQTPPPGQEAPVASPDSDAAPVTADPAPAADTSDVAVHAEAFDPVSVDLTPGATAPSAETPVEDTPPVAAVPTDGPIDDAQATELATIRARATVEALQTALTNGESDPLYDVALATRNLQLLDGNILIEGQTLQEHDQEAYEVLAMRRHSLEQVVTTEMENPNVQAALAAASEQAMTTALGGRDPSVVANEQFDYIASEGFQATLEGLPQDEQAARIQQELVSMAALDPSRVESASAILMENQIRNNGQEVLETMDEDTLAATWGSALSDPDFIQSLGSDVATANSLRTIMDGSSRVVMARSLAAAMQTDAFTSATTGRQRTDALLAYMDANLSGTELTTSRTLVRGLQTSGHLGTGYRAFSGALAIRGAYNSLTDADGATGRDIAAATSVGFSTADTGRTFYSLLRPGAAGASEVAPSAARIAGRVAGEALGPVADAIMLPLDIMALGNELDNQDTVGAWTSGVGVAASATGLAAGAFAIAAGSTAAAGASAGTIVGMPAAAFFGAVAVGAGVVGAGASLANWAWGESDLTGAVRQDLTHLGITGEGGSETRTADEIVSGRSRSEIREELKSASVAERLAVINYYIDGATTDASETLVANILTDAAENAPEDFGALVANLPMGRISNELDQAEVRQVLDAMTSHAQATGRPPGEVASAFLEGLARDHRQEDIDYFMAQMPEDTLDAIPSDTVRTMATSLMDGITSGAESETLLSLIDSLSDEQFFDMISGQEGNTFIRRFTSEYGYGSERRAFMRRVSEVQAAFGGRI